MTVAYWYGQAKAALARVDELEAELAEVRADDRGAYDVCCKDRRRLENELREARAALAREQVRTHEQAGRIVSGEVQLAGQRERAERAEATLAVWVELARRNAEILEQAEAGAASDVEATRALVRERVRVREQRQRAERASHCPECWAKVDPQAPHEPGCSREAAA